MKSIMYGGLIGLICGVVWVFGSFSGMLLVLALTLIGSLVGAIIWKLGGIRTLIGQMISDE
ncbi:hypothetical protein KTE19_05785 [Lentilactobacillus sp. IMAU92037]|uniref:hypothetical protein n=1 Tax=Lentilactobacillus TaxID=2767893 RepID=UPI001C2B7E81|nr:MULTISPECIES: hypothetical protein [Lentilactobacillus]MBV0930227.1 hypothetical protein [Lentilactobacillus dabitei]MDM7517071.1 hypothetical protein [Lentilactobacillus sp. TOM.63]